MREKFPGYFRPTDQQFEELWNSGIIVVDANILLNLYRLPEEAREDLLKILEALSERLWVPYFAFLEFLRNRPTVVDTQYQRFSDVRKAVEEKLGDLKKNLDEMQLAKRHSNISTDQFFTALDSAKSEFLSGLDEAKGNHIEPSQDDPLLQKIEQLLEGRIGEKPNDQQELEKIWEAGETRYNSKTPPGFSDQDKSDELFTYDGLEYRPAYGDLLNWLSTLDYLKQSETKTAMFVTDDSKPDWWLRVGKGFRRKISPRPELVSEAIRLAGLSVFHIYSNEQFMRYASQHLDYHLQDESLDQVESISQQLGPNALSNIHLAIKSNRASLHVNASMWTIDYLTSMGAKVSLEEFPRIRATTPTKGTIGVEISSLDNLEQLAQVASNFCRSALDLADESSFSHIHLLIVVEGWDQAQSVLRNLELFPLPANFSYVVAVGSTWEPSLIFVGSVPMHALGSSVFPNHQLLWQ